ncbi:patatin-like phospholipase family protein [Oricola sp.]|uniref:patatin-like phospholipase family protein n=1 Tax=Oricola sp. TaxID=1979950 RepID=UPI0025D1638B|nr:patatin-like phospholipase family protein [Oricola sp.]MCI5078566.1 patatin-like phospholipase family protein [Oricola sp.]
MLGFPTKIWSRTGALLAATALAGCVSVNSALNSFSDLQPTAEPGFTTQADSDAPASDFVALAFSGGGTRAAAFALGVLEEMKATPFPGEEGVSAFDKVRFLSGVSGGSVAAAYFGLKGDAAFADFKSAFLLRNGEEYLRTSKVDPVNLLRAANGGVNSRQGFGRWLDENLFKGATFGDLYRNEKTTTWINASDIYNRTPFTFEPETFRALCSDLRKLPLAEAVAASAAVPIVFSPIVLEAYGPRCRYQQPAWLTTAAHNVEASASLRAYARALRNYRDPEKMRYVKLLDGAVTDNFGLTGISIARARAQTRHAPFTEEEAVALKRMLFIVSNAGRELDGDWATEVAGPGGLELVSAIADTAMASATREGFDAFNAAMKKWQQDLIAYRCSLKPAEVRKYGGDPKTWNCRNLKLSVAELRFDQLGDKMEARLNKVPTRLKLPRDEVDLTISAGRQALAQHAVFRTYLRSIEGIARRGKRRVQPDG